MKSRLVLLIILILLMTFLFVFQNFFDNFYASAVLIGIMVGYCLFMQVATKHRERKLRKNPPEINPNYKPFISIMIPAHNEENVIKNTVENITSVDYDNYELILIDDRSDDNTSDVMKELASKNDRIKTLKREKGAFPGKSAVLNDAFVIAKGDAVLVFDADARIEPDFIKKIVPMLEPKDVGAVQARKVIINRDDNILTRCQDNEMTLDTHFQIGRDAVKGAVELRGNGELIKREALLDIGGWNNYTITDDLDMSTRLHIKGWDVRFCPDVIVKEEGVLTCSALLKQRRRWIEGSIRRYLENFPDALFSKEMSLRAGIDMTAYITEFLLPFWFFSETGFQIFRYVKQVDNQVLSSIVFSVFICIFFFTGQMHALEKHTKLKPKEIFKQSFETCVYLITLWFPIVVFMVFKIIFTEKKLEWGKTEHGTVLSTEFTEQTVNK